VNYCSNIACADAELYGMTYLHIADYDLNYFNSASSVYHGPFLNLSKSRMSFYDMAYLIRACHISYTSCHDIPNAFMSVLLIKNFMSKNKANRSLCIVHGIDHHVHEPVAKKTVELHRKNISFHVEFCSFSKIRNSVCLIS
jgi:hypothetical protein